MTAENISRSNLHERMLPTRRGRTWNLLITSRARIKLYLILSVARDYKNRTDDVQKEPQSQNIAYQ